MKSKMLHGTPAHGSWKDGTKTDGIASGLAAALASI